MFQWHGLAHWLPFYARVETFPIPFLLYTLLYPWTSHSPSWWIQSTKDPFSTGSYRGIITLACVWAKSWKRAPLLWSHLLLSEGDCTVAEKVLRVSQACSEIGPHPSRFSLWLLFAVTWPPLSTPCIAHAVASLGTWSSTDWYTDPQSFVWMCSWTSSSLVSHGVRQGSVFSPVLFLPVTDPVLLQLSSWSCPHSGDILHQLHEKWNTPCFPALFSSIHKGQSS